MTTEPRIYGQWAGNPKGFKEDVTRCIESVYPPGRATIPDQCQRKRGYGPDGLYCAIHNPEKVAARAAKQTAKWEAENRKQRIEWNGPALLKMLEEILSDYEHCAVEGDDPNDPIVIERKQRIAEAKVLIAKCKGMEV